MNLYLTDTKGFQSGQKDRTRVALVGESLFDMFRRYQSGQKRRTTVALVGESFSDGY